VSSTIALSPITVISAGSPGPTLTGGANIATILSDNLTTTYITYTSKALLDGQILRLGFGSPSGLPSGAQIVSVSLQQTVLSVATGSTPPQHCHWFRRPQDPGLGLLTTLLQNIAKDFYTHKHPVQDTPTWTTETVFTRTADPTGAPWTLASFTNFEVNVGRSDAGGTAMSIAEMRLIVTYESQGTISITAPANGSTNTTTGTPAVQWAIASSDQLAEEKFNVAVYSDAQTAALGFVPFQSPPTVQSGWTPGDDLQWIVPQALTNGIWHAYVQIDQAWDGTGDFFSNIATTSWTQSLAGCPDPVLQSATFDATNNRIALTMVPSSNSSPTAVFQVLRSDNNGPFNLIRFGVNVTANGMTPVTAFDYEALANKAARYKVQAFGLVGGIYLPSANYSSILTVTPQTNEDFWLIDPINPLGNTKFPVAYRGDSVEQQKNYGVFSVLSSDDTTYKVALEGSRFGIEGTLQLIFKVTDPIDYWAAFDNLDSSRHTLALKYPTGEIRFIRLVSGQSGTGKSWEWDVTRNNDDVYWRRATVSYLEVRPLAIG
jgi:hypothetical protein